MSTAPAPAPSLATPMSLASPTRPGRLRGLSYKYLRHHYAHNHNHQNSRDSDSSSPTGSSGPSALTRSTSYPTTSASVANRQNPAGIPTPHASPSVQRATADQASSESDTAGPTSGWLPTVGGQSAISRTATQPQPISTPSSSALLSGSNNGTDEVASATVMGRSRSATDGRTSGLESTPITGEDTQHHCGPGLHNANHAHAAMAQLPSIRFSQHTDIRAPRPSLMFSPMSRTLPTGKEVIRVGRYSERESQPSSNPSIPSSAPVGFKSKVVSRRHCEFWMQDGIWYIKDVKSSSGTFLNHVRLSSPGTESKPFPVKDGDIVQLGIDFKGGEEMIFRCVKIRVELNRGWQSALNSFNVASHKALRNMARQSLANGTSSQDCSICLGAIAPCQSLFVAPCSHTWHYKCVRRIINGPLWPQFICPNCRAVADLEAEVDDPYADGDWEEVETIEAGEAVLPRGHTEGTISADIGPIVESSQETTETTNILDLAIEHEPHIEPHLHPSSDDSDPDVQDAAADMNNLIISSADLPPRSHSLSAPVDIPSGRNSTSRNADDRSNSRSDHTPSPNARMPANHLLDTLVGPEGPMTPTNDAGPFVFDGTAGRVSGARAALIAAAEREAHPAAI